MAIAWQPEFCSHQLDEAFRRPLAMIPRRPCCRFLAVRLDAFRLVERCQQLVSESYLTRMPSASH
jgi:hypothetical protein